MSGNEARVYEANDGSENSWINGANLEEAPAQERWEREADDAHGVIRLRLCLRDRTPPGSNAGGPDAAGRKRGKRTPSDAGQDRTPPPRPRIVWRREDEGETRPPPAIIME
jgi:hypothetical protein